MTYYELITYLDNLITKTEILDSDIDYINNKEISLEGDRYVRFISQVGYALSERLSRYKDSFLEKLESTYLDKDNLILALSPLKKEIEYLKLIINIKYIKTENKNMYIKTIVESNNKMIDTFKKYFTDEERLAIFDNYYLEENHE